jgi:hypothetical protein
MSRPYNRDAGDPISLVSIDEALLNEVSSLGKGNPRKRMILRFHGHEEPLQRMLNAVEPESYVRPHRHLCERSFFIWNWSFNQERYASTPLSYLSNTPSCTFPIPARNLSPGHPAAVCPLPLV